MGRRTASSRSEEHTSELQSLAYLVCRLLLEKKKSALPIRSEEHTSELQSLAYLVCRHLLEITNKSVLYYTGTLQSRAKIVHTLSSTITCSAYYGVARPFTLHAALPRSWLYRPHWPPNVLVTALLKLHPCFTPPILCSLYCSYHNRFFFFFF